MRALLVIVGVCLLAGCSLISPKTSSNREAAKRTAELQELNLRVMRFADEYAGRVKEATTTFQATARSPQERLSAQNWKVQQSDSAYTIASGPNPISNSLDMVVLATLSRLVISDTWVADLYGTRARPLQEAHLKLEEGAWQLVSGFLTASQSAQLHEVIDRWRAQNPKVYSVAYIHFRDFAKSIGTTEDSGRNNLFALFGLDPLSQLDPAVREIAQTRALAERAIYYMQRVPTLLDMQVQRVAYDFAVMPETRSLLTDFERASHIGTAADRLVGYLPDMVAREREALVSQLMREVDDKGATLTALSTDVRYTLQAGTDTANALHATLETADRIAARFSKTAQPGAAPPSRRFDITEYTQMLHELSGTVRDLDTLAQHAGAVMPAVTQVTDQAAGRLQGIVDRAFLRLLVLVVVAIVFAWGGAIGYRVAVLAMQARLQERSNRRTG
jgi:hypothetical protein